MTEKTKPILTVAATEGEKLMIAGGSYRIVISGKQTGGSFSVIEMSVPPGSGPVPHAHPNIVESFYVLEGEITFKSEAGSYVAKKDACINIPEGGMVHCFKNLSDSPAKLLCTVMPAGLDAFFQEVAGYLETNPDEDDRIENIKLISEKYGQQLYPPYYLD